MLKSKMASIGDILYELSTTTPLNASATWVSDPIQPGQYNSLTVNIKSDTTSSVTAEWSAEGNYWDVSSTFNISANVGTPIAIVVTNKWIRITVTNTSMSNQTYLRAETYGVVTNNSTLAVLVSDIIGKLPNFNIANLRTNSVGIPIQTSALIESMNFTNFVGGNVTTAVPGVNQMQLLASNPGTDSYFSTAGVPGVGIGASGLNLGDYSLVSSTNYHSYTEGSVYCCTFSAKFDLTGPSVEGYCGIGNGSGSTATLDLQGFAGFGMYGSVFSIIIQDPINGVVRIPQSSWNIDKLDGSGETNWVLEVFETNSYRIIIDYAGYSIFQVQSPDSYYVSCCWIQSPFKNCKYGGMLAYTNTFDTNGLLAPFFTVDSWKLEDYLPRSPSLFNNITIYNLAPIALTNSTDTFTYFRFNSSVLSNVRCILHRLSVDNHETANTSPPFSIRVAVVTVNGHSGGSWSSASTAVTGLEVNSGGTSSSLFINQSYFFKSNTSIEALDIELDISPDQVYGLYFRTSNAPAGAGAAGNLLYSLDFKQFY